MGKDAKYYCRECGMHVDVEKVDWESNVTEQAGNKYCCTRCGSTVGIQPRAKA